MKSIKDFIGIVKKVKPTGISELRNRGYRLRYLGEGTFRITYRIVGLPIVIKFPLPTDDDEKYKSCAYVYESNVGHSNSEVEALRKIPKIKKLTPLRKYTPKLHYHDSRGVIIMEYCKPLRGKNKNLGKVAEAWQLSIGVDENDHDIGYWNVGKNAKGRLKIVDFGLFF